MSAGQALAPVRSSVPLPAWVRAFVPRVRCGRGSVVLACRTARLAALVAVALAQEPGVVVVVRGRVVRVVVSQ